MKCQYSMDCVQTVFFDIRGTSRYQCLAYRGLTYIFVFRIHAISVCDNAEYFHGHCNEMLQEVGLTGVKSENILDVIDGYKGQGYGLSTQEEIGKTMKITTGNVNNESLC